MAMLKTDYVDGNILYAGSILGPSGINAIDSRINQDMQGGYGNSAHGAFSLTSTQNAVLTRGQIYRYSTFNWVGPGSITAGGQAGAPVVIMVSGNCTIGSNTLINFRGAGMPGGLGTIGNGAIKDLGWTSWSLSPEYPMLAMAGSPTGGDAIGQVARTIYPNFFYPLYYLQGGATGDGNDSPNRRTGGGGGAGIISAGQPGSPLGTGTGPTQGGSSLMLGGIFSPFSGLTKMYTIPTLTGAGGGGGGGTNTSQEGGDNGGAGGGTLILLVGGNLIFSGTVDVRGSGGQATNTAGAGGGGGGGGLCLMMYEGTGINQGTVLTLGGPGGSPPTGTPGGSGGSGLFIFQQSNGFML